MLIIKMQLKYINKRGKPLLILEWQTPADLLAWAEMVKNSGAEFRNIEAKTPVKLQGDKPAEATVPVPTFSKDELIDIYSGVISARPTLNWRRVISDSVFKNQVRGIELPEFYKKYKAPETQTKFIVGKI